jgi:tellurite resistance protein TerC
MQSLFPFSEYWWFYAGFALFVLLMLALDLGVFHRKAHRIGFREAAIWTAVWIMLALVFNYFLYQYALWKFPQDTRLLADPSFIPDKAAWQTALEFLTGYIVEKSLSIDNIFIIVMIFSYLAIPAEHQHRVLFYGIIGALIFRAVFIGMGSILMQYHWLVILFGGFLILTGIKMFFSPEKAPDPSRNPLIRLFKRFVPVTDQLHGQRFWIKENRMWYATPLFVALLLVEITDVIFAVDSVPAIFALTSEPLIVFTSNIFALLGLRSMYFMLAGAVDRFFLLKYGLALILMFVGLKMAWLNELFGGKFPITVSLAIIGGILSTSILLSLILSRKRERRRTAAAESTLPTSAN